MKCTETCVLRIVPFLQPKRCFEPRQGGRHLRRIPEPMKRLIIAFTFIVLSLCGEGAQVQTAGPRESPSITTPPGSFFQLVRERDREAAHQFYKKYLEVKGLGVAAAPEVADQALARTSYVVTHLLAGRPDILSAMGSNGMDLIVIGQDQGYTRMPENSHLPKPALQNQRVRGTGGQPTRF